VANPLGDTDLLAIWGFNHHADPGRARAAVGTTVNVRYETGQFSSLFCFWFPIFHQSLLIEVNLRGKFGEMFRAKTFWLKHF